MLNNPRRDLVRLADSVPPRASRNLALSDSTRKADRFDYRNASSDEKQQTKSDPQSWTCVHAI
jgi:hypothetical protein